jgi:hypothetical protein
MVEDSRKIVLVHVSHLDTLKTYTVTNVLDDPAPHNACSKFPQSKRFGRRNQICCVTCRDRQLSIFV